MKYLKLYEKINYDDFEWMEDEIPESMPNDFYNFLTHNNCLEKWLHNFEVSNWYNDLKYFFLHNQSHKINYIGDAFDWCESPQGDNYWNILSIKWGEIIRETY